MQNFLSQMKKKISDHKILLLGKGVPVGHPNLSLNKDRTDIFSEGHQD